MRIVMLMAFLISFAALASDDVVPATSEMLDAFDAQLGAARNNPPAPDKSVRPASKNIKSVTAVTTSAPKDRFGAVVSAEAKKLKAADLEKKREFGKTVRDQVRNVEGDGGGDGNGVSRPGGEHGNQDGMADGGRVNQERNKQKHNKKNK